LLKSLIFVYCTQNFAEINGRSGLNHTDRELVFLDHQLRARSLAL